MFNWDEFRNEKVAVWCDTEEKAREFVKECYKRGIYWKNFAEPKTMFDWYKENTCYNYETDVQKNTLMYADKPYYKSNGYKIIKWESENMKFKVGDKVISSKDTQWSKNTKYRTIIKVLENGYKLSPYEKCTSSLTWYDYELKLYEEPTEFTFQELIARNIPGVYVNCNDEDARVQSIVIHEDGDFSINAEFKGLKEINLGLGINHNLKFKLQEPKKKYVLYGIEHQENGKIYFFRSKGGNTILGKKAIPGGSFVICDTSKGKTYGRAVQRVEKELTEGEYLKYKECWRA